MVSLLAEPDNNYYWWMSTIVERVLAVKSSNVTVQAVYGCCDEGVMEDHGGKELQCHGPDCQWVL